MNLRKIGKWSGYWLVSIKDALGNTAMYAYQLNLGKQTVVEYRYDAWGNEIGAPATGVGALNPFRYRGYVYDDETKIYYLESRYCKPEWCRFISADAVLGKTGAVFSHNLFAYCRNNPIIKADPSGKSALALIGGLVVGLLILSGCSQSPPPQPTPAPTPSVGAARPYRKFEARTGPNCFGYALGLEHTVSIGLESTGNVIDLSPGNIDNIRTTLENDVRSIENTSFTIRRIDGVNGGIKPNEYRIAFRIGTKPYKGSLYDYHFLVQTDSGQWAGRSGAWESTLYPPGETPETISWDLADKKGYYDSSIYYYAIGD